MRSRRSPSRIALLAVVLAACNSSSLTAPASRSLLVACPIDATASATAGDQIGHDVALPPEVTMSDSDLASDASLVSGARAEEARPVCPERVSPFFGKPSHKSGVDR